MDEQDKKDKQNQKRDTAAVQEELEQQLRDLGVGVNELKDAVNDAFRHGFEGRGDELGRHVNHVASDVTAVLNSVVGEVAGAFQDAMDLESGADKEERAERRRQREHRRQQQREARRAARQDSPESQAYDYAQDWQTGPGKISWGRCRSDGKRGQSPDPGDNYDRAIRWSARKRCGIGLALSITFGILAFSFFVGAIACFISTEALVVSSIPVAEAALAWTGIGLMVGGGLCTGGALYGCEQLEASRLLNRCADAFAGLDVSEGVDLDDLAGLLQMKKKKLRKQLRELINRGWLTGWMDERSNLLFLSAADYRAAHNIAAPQPAPEQPKPQEEEEAKPLHLETARRFAQVLAKERRLMTDPTAADELEKMQKTTEAICAWLESHPESALRARRFAEYYIPTTLKLLHTYNDVQGQKGDNAEAIRRDIGGILHTLNTAYENLYDNLLSDAALDVSSEIAALEGMLASDGLTGEGLL